MAADERDDGNGGCSSFLEVCSRARSRCRKDAQRRRSGNGRSAAWRSEALGHDHSLHGVIQRLLVPMVDELLGAPDEGLRVALGRERLQSATARGAELDPAAAVALVHEGIHGIAAAGGSGA